MRIFGRKALPVRAEQPVAPGDMSLPDVLDGAARHIDEVVASAGRASAGIRALVEQQRRMSGDPPAGARAVVVEQLAQSLVERTEQLRREAESLSGILVRAASGLGPAARHAPRRAHGDSAGRMGATSTPQLRTLPLPPHQARPAASNGKNGTRASDPEGRVSEGMRLLITQMSLAGSSKSEIEARLHRDFGVSNADDLLAEVFGRTG